MARRKKTIRNSFWFKRRGIERRGKKRPVAFQSSGKGPNLEVLAQRREAIRTHPFARNIPLQELSVVPGYKIQEYMDRHQRTKHSIVVNPDTGKKEEQDNCPPQIRVALRLYWSSEFHHGIETWHSIKLYERSDGNLWYRMFFYANRAIFVEYKYGRMRRSREYSMPEAHNAWHNNERGRGIYWLPGEVGG